MSKSHPQPTGPLLDSGAHVLNLLKRHASACHFGLVAWSLKSTKVVTTTLNHLGGGPLCLWRIVLIRLIEVGSSHLSGLLVGGTIPWAAI